MTVEDVIRAAVAREDRAAIRRCHTANPTRDGCRLTRCDYPGHADVRAYADELRAAYRA